MIFLTSKKYVHRRIKVNMKTDWWLKTATPVAFNPRSWKKISFINTVAMKISALYKCISTHSTPADINLDTVRFYQI